MNQREPTSVPRGAGQAFPCLALLLLPLLSGGSAWAHPQVCLHADVRQRQPYLVVLGAPPLRFQEPAPEAALVVRPPSPGASRLSLPEASAAITEDVYPPISETSSPFSSPHDLDENVAGAPIETDASISTPARSPLPILADDARPQTRPEDFLPFFQIPVNQPGDVNVIVPGVRAPGTPVTMPYSSAIYRQTP